MNSKTVVCLLFFLILMTHAKCQDRALFFAVNNYENLQSLSNPIKDAIAISKELETNYGFETEVIQNPDIQTIERTLESYANNYASGKFKTEEQLLIYFTGHGVVKFKNGFFMAKDSEANRVTPNGISYEFWRPFINSIPCKHILVALDACYSGTFDPNWYNKNKNVFARPGELSEGERLIVEHQKYTTRLFMTSATEIETPDKSSFAKKFLEGLRTYGREDGILTFTELFGYIDNATPRPHHGDFGDDEAGSSFLFISDQYRNAATFDADHAKQRATDLKAWQTAQTQNTIEAYEKYTNTFQNGIFLKQAQKKIIEIADQNEWAIAQALNTELSYNQYLSQYPNGQFSEAAKQKLNELQTIANDVARENYEAPTEKEKRNTNASPPNASVAYKMEGNTLIDLRNQMKYTTLVMKDGERWMTQNLDFNMEGAYCYKDRSKNCEKYGKLYTWEAAKKACPLGWHLPSDEEWRAMAKKYGGADDDASDGGKAAYKALSENGTSNFSAQLGGYRRSNGNYYSLGKSGYYWSSTEYDDGYAWYFGFDSSSGELYRFNYYKAHVQSVRCIKD